MSSVKKRIKITALKFSDLKIFSNLQGILVFQCAIVKLHNCLKNIIQNEKVLVKNSQINEKKMFTVNQFAQSANGISENIFQIHKKYVISVFLSKKVLILQVKYDKFNT